MASNVDTILQASANIEKANAITINPALKEFTNVLDVLYGTVTSVDETVEDLKTEAVNLIPKNFDPCKILELITKAQEFLEKVMALPGKLVEMITSLSVIGDLMKEDVKKVIAGGIEAVKSFIDRLLIKITTSKLSAEVGAKVHLLKIVVKKIKIIFAKIEMLTLEVKRILYRLFGKMLSSIPAGKVDAALPQNQAIATTMVNGCNAVIYIATIVSTILTMLNNLLIMCVNSAGMCFFPTPKSLVKVDVPITNLSGSIVNSLSDIISAALAEAKEAITIKKTADKKTKIALAAAQGAASAATGFAVDSIGDYIKFSPQTIKNAINAILQSLFDADALPRYEKLKVSNIRFLTFLLTGLEPSMYRTFGAPI